jgi:hypothetical protein
MRRLLGTYHDHFSLMTFSTCSIVTDRLWLGRAVLAWVLLVMIPGAIASGQDAPESGRPVLQAGEFEWTPLASPQGPVVAVVSLPEQLLYVYRNGVRIGISTVSTGTPGHRTPTGIFQILEKRVRHFSSKYNNAPMPHMQRLTWAGVALHAGHLPGYPASHGCIRLPKAFAENLFEVTSVGGTVVITGERQNEKTAKVLYQMASHMDDASGAVWKPELSPVGPLSLVLSVKDERLYIHRKGIRIGECRVRIDASGRGLQGTFAFILLDLFSDQPSQLVPGKPAPLWQALATGDETDPLPADLAGMFSIPRDFAEQVHAILIPGAVAVVTSESSTDDTRRGPGFVIMSPDEPPPEKKAETEPAAEPKAE